MEVFRTYTQMSEGTLIVTGCLFIVAIGVTIGLIIGHIADVIKHPELLSLIIIAVLWFLVFDVAIEGSRDTYVIADAATIDWGTVTRHYRPTEINDRLVTLKVLEAEE